jgi:hypothetical protein
MTKHEGQALRGLPFGARSLEQKNKTYALSQLLSATPGALELLAPVFISVITVLEKSHMNNK